MIFSIYYSDETTNTVCADRFEVDSHGRARFYESRSWYRSERLICVINDFHRIMPSEIEDGCAVPPTREIDSSVIDAILDMVSE